VNRSICTIGTGYVGMASMLGLAELGWAVNGYDILPERVRKLQSGVAPYREAGIEDALHLHLASGRLAFFESLEEAARDAELIIVAVGTPARDDGSADLSSLYAAVEELAKLKFSTWPTVVIRSTVPPGTSDQLAKIVEGWGELVYAPEFLREGSAVYDFLHPDRIVVGSESAGAAVPYVKLFESLQKPVLFTSRSNAELIKCGSNAFLALKISFANEIANLCDALGASSDDVLRGIGYDNRIGSQFLNPGIGFGGPCFEKDVKSIEHVAASHNMGRELFSATLRVNSAQQRRIADLVEDAVGSLEGLTIGVWGLAFKAGTDDVRDSLALRIIEMLAERGATVVAYDPAVHVTTLPKNCRLVPTALEATQADALVVLTEWPEFAAIPPRTYASHIRRRIVIDGRNLLDAERVVSAGLTYRGVGRPIAGNVEPLLLASAL
jgi:UDPglucose 6-dehydrogenase